jgi:hypothetical protein
MYVLYKIKHKICYIVRQEPLCVEDHYGTVMGVVDTPRGAREAGGWLGDS